MTNNNDELDKIDFMITVQHYQPPLQEHQITEMRIRLEDKAKQALINWRDKHAKEAVAEFIASDDYHGLIDKAIREARILELKELLALVIGLGNYMEIEVVIENQLAHLRNEDKDNE